MKKFNNLNFKKEVFNTLNNHPNEVWGVLKKIGEKGTYLIGGAVRDSIVNKLYNKRIKIADYDFFCKNKTSNKLKKLFSQEKNISYSRFGSPKLIFNDFEIDLIPYDNTIAEFKYGRKPNLKNILLSSDITTSSIAYSFEKGNFITERGMEGILKKEIDIMNPNSLVADLSRLLLHSNKLNFSLVDNALIFISKNYNPILDEDIINYLNYKHKEDKIDFVLGELKKIKKY